MYSKNKSCACKLTYFYLIVYNVEETTYFHNAKVIVVMGKSAGK